MSSSYHMEQKTFIEASCIYDIHTWEKSFCSCLLFKVYEDRVKKFVVHFGQYESSLHFYRREDQTGTVYKKKI